MDLALSGFERPFDQYFRQFHWCLRDFRALGRSLHSCALWAVVEGLLEYLLGGLVELLSGSWVASGSVLGGLGEL